MPERRWRVDSRDARGRRLRQVMARSARRFRDTGMQIQAGHLPGTSLSLRSDGIHGIPRRRRPLPWDRIGFAYLGLTEWGSGDSDHRYEAPRIHLLLRPERGGEWLDPALALKSWPGGSIVLDLGTFVGDPFAVLAAIRERAARRRPAIRIDDNPSRPIEIHTGHRRAGVPLSVALGAAMVFLVMYLATTFFPFLFIAAVIVVAGAMEMVWLSRVDGKLTLQDEHLSVWTFDHMALSIPWRNIEEAVAVITALEQKKGNAKFSVPGALVLLLKEPVNGADGTQVTSLDAGFPVLPGEGVIGLILARMSGGNRE